MIAMASSFPWVSARSRKKARRQQQMTKGRVTDQQQCHARAVSQLRTLPRIYVVAFGMIIDLWSRAAAKLGVPRPVAITITVVSMLVAGCRFMVAPRACVAIETCGVLTKGSCRRFRLKSNVPGFRKLLSQSGIDSQRKGISSPDSTRLDDRRIACPNCDTGAKLNSFQR
jgi:hypothetical protein